MNQIMSLPYSKHSWLLITLSMAFKAFRGPQGRPWPGPRASQSSSPSIALRPLRPSRGALLAAPQTHQPHFHLKAFVCAVESARKTLSFIYSGLHSNVTSSKRLSLIDLVLDKTNCNLNEYSCFKNKRLMFRDMKYIFRKYPAIYSRAKS